MLFVDVDELTNCLRDSLTGDIIDTESIRIKRKSFLRKFNKKTGWYTNWADLVPENEVYALVLKGTADIQGLIAIRPEPRMNALFLTWACTAPHNNKILVDTPKYIGVGGHLFAIAAKVSFDYGYEGAMTGYAANKDLVNHYCKAFNAEWIQALHPYQIFIDEENAKQLMEVYSYDWTDDEL